MNVYITALIKDEHQYIEEWIDYHLSIGVNKFYLFEEGENSHRDILKKYGDKVVLIKNFYHEQYRQLLVYRTTLKMFRKKCDWCAFIDVDEYIKLDERYNNNIENFLKEYSDYVGVHLSWKLYGADGNVEPCEKGKIQETYITPLNVRLSCPSRVKTIVNMKHEKLVINHAHNMLGSVNTNYEINEDDLYDKAWINHYYTKSLKDWIFKAKRGQLFDVVYDVKPFFECNLDMKQEDYEDVVKELM